jgi:hypothetical protein
MLIFLDVLWLLAGVKTGVSWEERKMKFVEIKASTHAK